MRKRPIVLMVVSGVGYNERKDGNAFFQAKTRELDRIMKENPCVRGLASGMAVGLPNGQVGNAEVGMTNIGAGRIVYQEYTRIEGELKDGSFQTNKALLAAIENCKQRDSALHLFGLLSDGGVHSHISHLFALLEMVKRYELERVYLHCILDGRDAPPMSGLDFIHKLQNKMRELGVGEIASIHGRYYAMDRDGNYDRVKLSYQAMTNGEGVKAGNADDAVRSSYDRSETDEFMRPTVIVNGGVPVATVDDHDSVIFFNFRSDRAREITHAFCDDDFRFFKRDQKLDIVFTCFSDNDPKIEDCLVAFEKTPITNPFGEWLYANGLKQLRISESEGSAQVTWFLNGGTEEVNEGEDRFFIKSPKQTADKKPEMSAVEVCENLLRAIRSDRYDVIIADFVNADIAGHTGVEAAAKTAIETVSRCVGRIADAIHEVDGVMFLCSDHGNIEQMIDYTDGSPYTGHTANPVPFVLINYDPTVSLREGGCLADIVPTLIDIMEMEVPREMTGKSLLIRN